MNPPLLAIASLPSLAEAHKVALANYFLAHKAEAFATMAVWEADLGKDADEARVIYRKVYADLQKAEASLAEAHKALRGE